MLVFWKCHDAHMTNCPARVATTKKEKTVRVVVINDVHFHPAKRRLSVKDAAPLSAVSSDIKPKIENKSETPEKNAK